MHIENQVCISPNITCFELCRVISVHIPRCYYSLLMENLNIIYMHMIISIDVLTLLWLIMLLITMYVRVIYLIWDLCHTLIVSFHGLQLTGFCSLMYTSKFNCSHCRMPKVGTEDDLPMNQEKSDPESPESPSEESLLSNGWIGIGNKSILKILSCTICSNIFRDPTRINLCLHICKLLKC